MGWFDFLGPLFGGGGNGAQQAMMGGGGAAGFLQPEPIGGAPGATAGTYGGVGGSIYDQLFSSPQFRTASLSNALMSAGAQMLKNSGPSTTPKSFGSILGSGVEAGLQGYEGTRDRFTKDLLLKNQLEQGQLARDTQRGWMEFMRGLAKPPAGGAPSVTPSGGGMPTSYYAGVASDESGGNPQATNPSGAGGMFQFLPGTWQSARAAVPGLPATPQEATPQQQQAAAEWFTRQNHDTMTRTLGRPPTGGELRLAHFFGAQGASGLLGLDPNTRFEQVPDGMLGAPTATVIAQNPSLRGQTIGSLLQGYRSRFDQFNPVGGGSQMAGIVPAGSGTPGAPQRLPPPSGPQGMAGATPLSPSSGGVGLPRVTSPQQLAALPPGTPFIAPDGSVRIR